MSRNHEKTSAGGAMTLFVVILNAIILEHAITQDRSWYAMLFITIPLLLMSLIGSKSKVP